MRNYLLIQAYALNHICMGDMLDFCMDCGDTATPQRLCYAGVKTNQFIHLMISLHCG